MIAYPVEPTFTTNRQTHGLRINILTLTLTSVRQTRTGHISRQGEATVRLDTSGSSTEKNKIHRQIRNIIARGALSSDIYKLADGTVTRQPLPLRLTHVSFLR